MLPVGLTDRSDLESGWGKGVLEAVVLLCPHEHAGCILEPSHDGLNKSTVIVQLLRAGLSQRSGLLWGVGSVGPLLTRRGVY